MNSTKPGWLSRNFLMTEIVLAMTGIILVLGGALVPSDQLSVALISLGITVLATSVLSVAHSIFGADTATLVSGYLEPLLKSSRHVYDIGLDAVYNKAGDQSIYAQLAHARTIDLMYNTAKFTIHTHGTNIFQSMVENGCVVRILVSDPNSIIWKDRVLSDGLCPDSDTPSEIGDVLKNLETYKKRFLERNPPPTQGSLTLKFCQTVPTCSIVIVDNHNARVTPYLPLHHGGEVPVFDVTSDRGGQGRLFDQYRSAFDRVWIATGNDPAWKVDFGTLASNADNGIALVVPHDSGPVEVAKV